MRDAVREAQSNGSALDSKEIALKIADSALSKKAEQVVILDVRKFLSYADYLVIMSGGSDRHTRAIADVIEKTMSEMGIKSLSQEGRGKAQWILIDYTDVVAHVLQESQREFYDLESLWLEAPRVNVPGSEAQD